MYTVMYKCSRDSNTSNLEASPHFQNNGQNQRESEGYVQLKGNNFANSKLLFYMKKDTAVQK